jgi:hypothetical protein
MGMKSLKRNPGSSFFVVILMCLCALAAQGGFASSAMAAESGPISVYVDGLPVVFDVSPVIQSDRTMVPFRALAEALNTNVTWDGTTQTVKAEGSGTSISLRIGSSTAYRNGTAVTLEAPPGIIEGRTLIPLRFFSEAMGCSVQWVESTRSVKIVSPPKDMTVVGFYALGDSSTSSWTNLFGTKFPQAGTGNTDMLTSLALGWYSLDREGKLLTTSRTGWQRPDDWSKVMEAAQKYRLKTEMVVHMSDGDGSASGLLSSDSAVSAAVSGIAAEAGTYDGVNIDIEGLGWSANTDRERFTRFAGLLSQRLKEAGISLTLTLHPLNSAYKGYDYRSLGGLADRIIVMAYDYGTKPEPVDKVIEAVQMASAAVPPEKLLLGISAPSETAESILTKVGIAKRYNLNGIALWRLGLVEEGMWSNLRASVRAH